MAIVVASQAASAARMNQPGVGAGASPPTCVGMSLAVTGPSAVLILHRRPPSSTAIAALSATRVRSGCPFR
jgi:hypothetical protein